MNLKTGKLPKKSDYRTLRFGSYSKALPPAPTAFNVLSRIIGDPKTLFPMDGNDQYGDCTCAARAHAETVFNALTGSAVIPTTEEVLAFYNKMTGGQDTGCNELDILKAWKKKQAFDDKLVAFVSVDPKNIEHVKQAIALFGGAYIGFQCQENVMRDFEAGRPWTPGKLTNDGHAVYVVAYDADTVTVLTWGTTQKGTWAWFLECCDECYGLLPIEAELDGFAPGFNFSQLKTDLLLIKN
jgi:hypothetical protein